MRFQWQHSSTRYTLICITLLNFQSRLQHTRETFRIKMGSIQEMQRVDRELSSELIESPVNPAFLHISTPLMQDCDPSFCLQVNGVALWEWRKLQSPGHIFDTLQNSLSRIGYRARGGGGGTTARRRRDNWKIIASPSEAKNRSCRSKRLFVDHVTYHVAISFKKIIDLGNWRWFYNIKSNTKALLVQLNHFQHVTFGMIAHRF